MKKYTYNLKTLSSVILSPRAQSAFYSDRRRSSAGADSDGYKIIYPFYQYGTYDQPAVYDSGKLIEIEPYTEEHAKKAHYYIPGSSIKGALGAPKCMVDDIPVPYGNLTVKQLSKVQYIPKECSEKDKAATSEKATKNEASKLMKIKKFFPNIGVQMLNAKVTLKGELFCQEDLKLILNQSQEETIHKINQYKVRLEEICRCVKNSMPPAELSSQPEEETNEQENCLNALKAVCNNLDHVRKEKEDDEFLFILGGYKGQLLSMISSELSEGAIYLDGIKDKDSSGTENGTLDTEKDTENISGYLPHGLVTIKITG